MLYCKGTCYRNLFWRNTQGQAPCENGRNFWVEHKPTVCLSTRTILHGNVCYKPHICGMKAEQRVNTMQRSWNATNILILKASSAHMLLRSFSTVHCLNIFIFPSKVTARWDSRLLAGQSRVQIPAPARDFLFSKTSRPAIRAHPASYSKGTNILYQG